MSVFRHLSSVICLLLFCGFSAFGNNFVAYELDPANLLTAESQDDDEETVLPYIPIPLQIDRFDLDVNLSRLAGINPTANLAAAVGDTSAQTDPAPADRPAQIERQLWKNRLSPLTQPGKENPLNYRTSYGKKDGLQDVIEQIRSIQIEPQNNQPQPPPVTTKTTTPEPNITPAPEPDAEPAEEPAWQPATAIQQAQKPGKSEHDQALQMAEELLKDPNHITNSLELAEALFQSGRTGPAGLCYKRALALIPANDHNMAGDRAWILFQIGNCFKYDDPNTSKESYAELIRTHPDSPWAQIARSRHGLVDWYQKDRPDKLIQELNKVKSK